MKANRANRANSANRKPMPVISQDELLRLQAFAEEGGMLACHVKIVLS
jgi:hypothetical protein